MPPQKGPIWQEFLEVKDSSGKVTKVICKHCPTEFNFPNATRMTEHITQQCRKCPSAVKAKFQTLASPPASKRKVTAPSTSYFERSPDEGADDPEAISTVGSKPTSEPSASHQQPEKRKKSGISNFFDYVSPDEKCKLDELFARAIYSKGLPLSTFEGPHMEAAFRALRPAYSLPSDRAFGGRLLEKEYHKVMERSKTTLSNALCISLCADGWTNRRGEGIVNIVAGTPEPVFLKSVEPGPRKEDAEFLFCAFVEVIDEIGEHKVLLINTDNAKVMQACWRLIQQRYSHIYAVGCGSHCLDLLFKDIMKVAFFRDLFADTKTLIKIRKRRQLYAVFKTNQTTLCGANKKSLVLPSPTRFSGAFFAFQCVLDNKQAFQQTVLTDGLIIPVKIHDVALVKKDFWTNLSFAVQYLKPLVSATHDIEANNATLSQMVAISMDVKHNLIDSHGDDCQPLPKKDFCQVSEAVKHRILNFCVKDIHLACYLVDPRFAGKGLSDNQFLAGVAVVKDVAVFLKEDVDAVVKNLADFTTRSDAFSKEMIWEGLEIIPDPRKWWEFYCKNQPFRTIAVRLLSLLPTATSCERIWSAYDHVHSKKRNRLLNTKVEKLVAVKANLKLSLFAPPEERGSKTARVSSECKTRKYAVTPLYDTAVPSKTSDVSDDDDDDDLWSSDEELIGSSGDDD